jgi:D-alanyl-D-alanine carboxypeptidase/D-alanyl-D-alanine-endopeptidase (penicillin-binding protein 4)
MSKSIRIVCVLLINLASIGSAQSLAKRLDARLDAAGLEHLLWGVAVTDMDGHLLYGRNADRLFIPASNTKLVVSIVGNALLGPDFTVRTSVYGSGPLTNGILAGDLVLYGRGDPTFSRRCYDADTARAGACDRDPAEKLRLLARQLYESGMRVVAGDIVGDGSYFTPQVIHPGWENYDLGWWYAAPVSGLGFNDNSVDFREIAGDSVGHAPQLIMTPDLGGFTLENRAEVTPRGSRRTFDIFRINDGLTYLATGALPAGGAPRNESAAVVDPNRYAALAFRHELAAAGIVVRGETRSTVDSFPYRTARATMPFAEVESRPLRDWLYPILSPSQNWFAEMLLKQLGKRFGTAGSWDEGRRVERRFLIDSIGVDSTTFSLQDGSGLAANNFVTPLAFTRLLRWARNHPGFAAINAGLPQSGKPGTLHDRFAGTPAANLVHAKTGSISGVNSLSGYVDQPDGRVLVFSVMANHHTLGGARMIAAIDSVIVELASAGPRRAQQAKRVR